MDDGVALRRATIADADALYAIEQRAYPLPWSELALRQSLSSDSMQCWMYPADASQPVLAYAFVQTVAGELQIINLAVDPHHQGRGLGKQVLRSLLSAARKALCYECTLEVRRSNRAARRLYESSGFESVGVRKNYYPAAEGREDAILMSLQLL